MTAEAELDPQPVRWDRAVWDEGDTDGAPVVFLMEFNAEGAVLRQIELAGPSSEPTAAASAAEWWEAQGWRQQAATPQAVAYQQMYGVVAEGTVDEWDPDYPGQSISPEEFERAWTEARAHLEKKSRRL